MTLQLSEIGEQFICLAGCLFVVEGLFMRKSGRRVQNMNHSRHIGMDKTDQLEVSDRWEGESEGLAGDHGRSRDAGRAIEDCRAKGKPWAADCKRRPHLAHSQEGDRVDLIGPHSPLNAVSG